MASNVIQGRRNEQRRLGADVDVTDVEGKNDGVDDGDVTRPASRTPSVPAGPAAADAANGSPAAAEGSDDAGGVAPHGGPAALRRLAPEESAGDVVSLSTNNYLLGRSRTCSVRLHSTTASRQHARIEARDGDWFLSSLGGKTVVVDGHPARGEVRLRNTMKIQLGGDEFIFLQEDSSCDDLAEEEETLVAPSARVGPRPVPVPEARGRPAVWIWIGAGVVLLGALAFWRLL